MAGLTQFQSTPSVGRATLKRFTPYLFKFVISIHALRGEGDRCCSMFFLLKRISIHALRGEGD